MMPDDQFIVSAYDADAEELATATPMLRAGRLRPIVYRDVREVRLTPEQLAERAFRAADAVAAVIAAREAGTYDAEEEPPRNFVRIRRPR